MTLPFLKLSLRILRRYDTVLICIEHDESYQILSFNHNLVQAHPPQKTPIFSYHILMPVVQLSNKLGTFQFIIFCRNCKLQGGFWQENAQGHFSYRYTEKLLGFLKNFISSVSLTLDDVLSVSNLVTASKPMGLLHILVV
jgi:hypothetical protein